VGQTIVFRGLPRAPGAGPHKFTDERMNQTLHRGAFRLEKSRHEERMVAQANDPDVAGIVRAFHSQVVSIVNRLCEIRVQAVAAMISFRDAIRPIKSLRK
jgi:hypothetical protein